MNTITILSVVDVAAALSNDTLQGNLHLFDNNKGRGSMDEGTEVLKTKVHKGDVLVWIVQPLECESFLGLAGVEIDKEYCDPRENFYEGTNITYWVGTVKRELDKHVPYILRFNLASRTEPMLTAAESSSSPCLIGDSA